MGTTAKTIRWVSLLALAAASVGAGAQALDQSSLVWVENESFGFEACAAMKAGPAGEDAPSTLAALRASAVGELGQAVRQAGVNLGGLQHMTMTPVSGSFACGAQASEVTFRIAAVDRVSGKFWSSDMKVRSTDAAPDQAAIAELADDLARSFRGVVTQSAMR